MSMVENPLDIPIYHITHVDNLPWIIREGALLSDAMVRQDDERHTVIGMGHIKQRRLNELNVLCHPDTKVGEYVPFYFCPRSIMLYMMYMKNSELGYQDGQGPIVHLVSTVGQALKMNRRWTFSTSNAGARLTDFYNNLDDLDKVDWEAVAANDWTDCKEAKQAEFLVHERFDWSGITQIGVYDGRIAQQVDLLLAAAKYKPPVKIMQSGYY